MVSGISETFDSRSNEWYRESDCRGKELNLFFELYESDDDVAQDVDELCAGCPVRMHCLAMGINTAGTGVHGGVYLNQGRYSKKNDHKDEDVQEYERALIKKIKGLL